MPAIHPVALYCTAFLGLLLFGLGFAVSMTRFRVRVGIGMPEDPDAILSRLVRAHGNTAEFAPFLAVLFLLLGARDPSTLALWLMGLATLARLLLVVSLLIAPTLRAAHPLRFIGAASTYTFGAWLCLLLALSV